jgi:hypothetical protein
MENKTKTVALFKGQVSKATAAANELQVRSDLELVAATTLLGRIKSVYKMVKEMMDAPIKTAYNAYKEIKAQQEQTFGAFVSGCEDAELIVKTKMLDYHKTQLAASKDMRAQVEKKVTAGKMSFEKAADKIEAATPQKSIAGTGAAAQFRTIRTVVIEDESKLPREYLLPDMGKIRKVALAGVAIPGVRVVEEQSVAGRTKL